MLVEGMLPIVDAWPLLILRTAQTAVQTPQRNSTRTRSVLLHAVRVTRVRWTLDT